MTILTCQSPPSQQYLLCGCTECSSCPQWPQLRLLLVEAEGPALRRWTLCQLGLTSSVLDRPQLGVEDSCAHVCNELQCKSACCGASRPPQRPLPACLAHGTPTEASLVLAYDTSMPHYALAPGLGLEATHLCSQLYLLTCRELKRSRSPGDPEGVLLHYNIETASAAQKQL